MAQSAPDPGTPHAQPSTLNSQPTGPSNLVLAKANEPGEKSISLVPARLSALMPRLQASDYDYIIFDMPPINQLSVTPRIAKFMDIVLLVIESEKTDREIVKRAVALLAESKPNLGAVLNKRRSYVPKILQQEL